MQSTRRQQNDNTEYADTYKQGMCLNDAIFKVISLHIFIQTYLSILVIASANLFAKYFVCIKIVMLDINRLFLGKSMQVF